MKSLLVKYNVSITHIITGMFILLLLITPFRVVVEEANFVVKLEFVKTKKDGSDNTVKASLTPLKTSVKAKDTISDYEAAMAFLKVCEASTGFHSLPYWDVNRWSSGWGTKAMSKTEKITRAEGDRRCRNHFTEVFNRFSKQYPQYSRWERLILSCTLYNVSGFGPDMKSFLAKGDREAIARQLLLYDNDADGNKLDGLTKRRQAEAEMFLARGRKKIKLVNQYVDSYKKIK